MSLGILGALLLLVLAFMVWRNGVQVFPLVLAILLGVIIAASGGPMATTAHAMVDGMRTGLNALGTLFGAK